MKNRKKTTWKEWVTKASSEMEKDPTRKKPNGIHKAEGYDEALMGLVQRCGEDPEPLYDTDKILEILVARDGMTCDDAVAFFESNIIGYGGASYFSKDSLEVLQEEIEEGQWDGLNQ